MRPLPAAILVGVFAVALAACGGGSNSAVRTGSTSPPKTTTTSSTTTTTLSPSRVAPKIVATPATNLLASQRIQITGSGFSKNEPLVVTECADKGTATTSNDCNLAGMVQVITDANGKVSASIVVLKGPFGVNRIVCGPTQRCLVSVTQAALQPTEEADAQIQFR